MVKFISLPVYPSSSSFCQSTHLFIWPMFLPIYPSIHYPSMYLFIQLMLRSIGLRIYGSIYLFKHMWDPFVCINPSICLSKSSSYGSIYLSTYRYPSIYLPIDMSNLWVDQYIYPFNLFTQLVFTYWFVYLCKLPPHLTQKRSLFTADFARFSTCFPSCETDLLCDAPVHNWQVPLLAC